MLREDGFRTIVVNSNPATIMTDPGFADRTYLEPLDVEGVADVLGSERPDALLPTMGGQPRSTSPRACPGGRARRCNRADRRAARRDPPRRGSRALPGGGAERSACAGRESQIVTAPDHLGGRRAARGHSAGVHARRARRRLRATRDELARQVEPGLARVPDRPGARRGVDPGAGTSSSSRSSADRGTTSSSSARSRPSTRWACTPATRSPWRRR